MLKINEILEPSICKMNDENIKKLEEIVSSEKVTWILGAGISVPAGLPQWETLLAKMWSRLSELEIEGENSSGIENRPFIEARKGIISSITDRTQYKTKVKMAMEGKGSTVFQGANLLEAAEYIQNYINELIQQRRGTEDKRLFFQILRGLIKDSIQPERVREDLVDILKTQAIDEIANLLAAKKSGIAITYNYDDILELCIEKKNVEVKDINVVDDKSNDFSVIERKINIYHPHGALNVVGSQSVKDSERIVLTETSYYDLEKKTYNWENSIQARALLDTTCVFIGFSGEDYNFRRIIKNVDYLGSEGKKGKHYILVSINAMVESLFKVAKKSDEELINLLSDEKCCYEKLQMIQKLYAQYVYWRKHGITPIWTTYAELPEVIRQIAGGKV